MSKKEIVKNENNNPERSFKQRVLEDLNKEIEHTLKENATQYKEEIKQELIEDVHVEIANFMKKEEKRILRTKNIDVFKRDFIIVLLIGIIIYFSYCLYDVKYFNFMKSECERNGTCYITNPNSNEPGTNPPEPIKDKEWYKENYGYLLDNIKTTLNAENVSSYYLYSNDYKISEIKPAYLLNMAYKQVSPKKIKTNTLTISVEGADLKAAFESLFGSLTYYKEGSFSYDCLNFTYNKTKDRYTADNTKCQTDSNLKIIDNIDEMYEEGEVLYIITTATIYNEKEKSYYTFDNLFDAAATDVTPEDITKNAKKLNKYQYQFKKADDKYILDAIVKLK